MRERNRLSASFVKFAPVGRHCHRAGLWFQKRDDGGAQWFLRVKAADKWRSLEKAGQDPIKVREREATEAARADHTLRSVAEEAFEARKAELKGDGKAGRWFSPLELHILPKLGGVPIDELDQRDIRDVLAPIWHTKAETAAKIIAPVSTQPMSASARARRLSHPRNGLVSALSGV